MPVPDCTVDPIADGEIGELAAIGKRTFLETFAANNDPAQMAAYVAKAFAPETLASELSSAQSHFFFARVDGVVAGYLKLNSGSAQTETVEGKTLEIERIYVDAGWHGAGVGKALMDHAIAEAKRRGCEAVWLGVWEENPRAIAFYRRQGFTPFGTHGFVIGDEVQTDVLMRLAL